MWLWALIGSAILAAVFFIVTLAQLEAGAKARGKWLIYTFCALAVVAGLIVFKPKPNMEEFQYLPPAPGQDQIVDDQATTQQESDSRSMDSSGVTAEDGGLQGSIALSPENGGDRDSGEDAQEQGQGDSLAKYRDPVLEEILLLKRQAKERKGDAQQNTELYSERMNYYQSGGSTGENQQQIEGKTAQKASVTATSLNVRDKGGMDGEIIGNLKSGDVVEIVYMPETDDWIQVKLDSGQTGWVIKKYLNLTP